MTARRFAVAGLALALLARGAAAFEASAVVGGGYSQTDNWAAGLRDRFPVWNWTAGGSFRASPLSPGLLQLDGAVQYDALRNTAAVAPSNSNGLTFRGGALLAADYAPTSAYASRALSDFAVDAATPQTGSSLTDIYGGSVRYQLGAGPLLEASASRTDQTTRPLVGEEYRQLTNRAAVQASQSLNAFDYKLNYETSWSDGSFVDANYRQHGLAFTGGADLGKEDRVQLSAQYSLRDPLVKAATNPRFDAEFLQGTAMLGTQSRWSGFLTYSYTHSLVEALLDPTLEQTNHSASYTATYRYSPSLLLNASAGASYGIARNDAESLHTTGEQVGFGATWSRGEAGKLQLELGGTGSVGALQAAGGASLPGYGAGLSGSVRDSWRLWSAAATYQLNVARNLGAIEGTSFTQRLALSAETRRLAGVVLGSRLTFSGSRRDVALLGASVDRSITAGVSAAWRRLRGEATAGTSDGLAATLRTPGFSDGLFLSPSFNTHSRYATVQLSHALSQRLSLGALGRWLDSTGPDRPRQYEVSGSMLLGYDIGQFTFRLEDRLTHGGNGDAWARTNLVFARVERRFDLRF
jgi:hypothetical protein